MLVVELLFIIDKHEGAHQCERFKQHFVSQKITCTKPFRQRFIYINFNGPLRLHNIYIIIYDVIKLNIRCVLLITAIYRSFDIVTEPEPEVSDDK